MLAWPLCCLLSILKEKAINMPWGFKANKIESCFVGRTSSVWCSYFCFFFFLLKKGKIHKWVRLYTWIVLLGSLKIWNCIFSVAVFHWQSWAIDEQNNQDPLPWDFVFCSPDCTNSHRYEEPFVHPILPKPFRYLDIQSDFCAGASKIRA